MFARTCLCARIVSDARPFEWRAILFVLVLWMGLRSSILLPTLVELGAGVDAVTCTRSRMSVSLHNS